MTEKEFLIAKLNNVLRSDASTLVTKLNILSPEKTKERMQAIEELKHYIDNYEENMKLIHQAKEDNLRMEDDGR